MASQGTTNPQHTSIFSPITRLLYPHTQSSSSPPEQARRLDGPERIAFMEVEELYFRPALRFFPNQPLSVLAMAIAVQTAYLFFDDEAPSPPAYPTGLLTSTGGTKTVTSTLKGTGTVTGTTLDQTGKTSPSNATLRRMPKIPTPPTTPSRLKRKEKKPWELMMGIATERLQLLSSCC